MTSYASHAPEHAPERAVPDPGAWLAGWLAALDYFADMIGGRLAPARPTQLEILRWGPGGRAAFGAPRLNDYPGKDGDT
jgi:hypothetical protein